MEDLTELNDRELQELIAKRLGAINGRIKDIKEWVMIVVAINIIIGLIIAFA